MEIWEARGKNYSDVGSGPFYGYYEGKREDVIEWIELKNPGFKKELKEQYGSKLTLLAWTKITKKSIKELREAQEQKKAADLRLKKAEKAPCRGI